MSRTRPAVGLMGVLAFALTLALPAISADASDRHRSSHRSSSGVSIGLHFGSGSSLDRHRLRHGSSLRHRLHSPSYQRHRLSDRHHTSLRHRSIYPHRSYYHYDYAPRRRLLDRHYSHFNVVPPSSSVYIYRSPSYYSYRLLEDDLSSAARRQADLERYRQRTPTYRPLDRYRSGGITTTPRREYVYPYLDQGDKVDVETDAANATEGGAGAGADAAAVGRRGTGWDLLRTDNTADARNVFALESERQPRSPAAHLGYALAVADAGEFEAAYDATRRAVLLDPAALVDLPMDHVMERQVREVLGKLDADNAATLDAAERLFLKSALHTMLGEYGQARTAVNEALAERDAAAFALKGFVDSLGE